jgi:hypothetical protein
MTFAISFGGGGTATVRVDALDRRRLVLEATFDAPVAGAPFAALRSMYVTDAKADVARVGVHGPRGDDWREEPVMEFGRATATGVWAGRLVPSRHNASAPDLKFDRFDALRASR